MKKPSNWNSGTSSYLFLWTIQYGSLDVQIFCEALWSLQAEFNDVTNGLIELQDTVLISKMASEKNQTSEEFYQEFFETEQKRLRLEEEKSYDDNIGNGTRPVQNHNSFF